MTCSKHGGIPFNPPTTSAFCNTQKKYVTAILVGGRYLCPDCDADKIKEAQA